MLHSVEILFLNSLIGIKFIAFCKNFIGLLPYLIIMFAGSHKNLASCIFASMLEAVVLSTQEIVFPTHHTL